MLRYVMVVLVVTRGTLSQCERNLCVGGVRDDKWISALTHLDKAVLMMMGSGRGDYDGDGDDEIDDHSDGYDGAL